MQVAEQRRTAGLRLRLELGQDTDGMGEVERIVASRSCGSLTASPAAQLC